MGPGSSAKLEVFRCSSTHHVIPSDCISLFKFQLPTCCHNGSILKNVKVSASVTYFTFIQSFFFVYMVRHGILGTWNEV